MIRFLSFSLLKEIEGTRAITSLAFLMPLYSSPQKLTTGAEPAPVSYTHLTLPTT